MLTNTFGLLYSSFSGSLAFLNNVVTVLESILVPILIVVATAGSIYAVILGVNMAKAESAEKREEAKKRIINAVIALAVVIVLILVMRLFISNIGNWLGTEESSM